MMTYYFKGKIVLDSPLHIGSGEKGDFVDSPVIRDETGKPFIPGTTLAGIMASTAKRILRLHGASLKEADKEPVFRALFGNAAEDEGGRQSRLVVRDTHVPSGTSLCTFIQDCTSIDRTRESAQENHLFHQELVPEGTQFDFLCSFAEKASVSEEVVLDQEGAGANAEALYLFMDALELMTCGWVSVGGRKGTGRGRFSIRDLKCFRFDRTDPDDVLKFVQAERGYEDLDEETIDRLRREQGSAPYLTAKEGGTSCNGPEILTIRGIIRPLDPFLVKSGYSLESVDKNRFGSKHRDSLPGRLTAHVPVTPPNDVSVDSSFCTNGNGYPYLPGSSIRGCFRSRLEKHIRTIVFKAHRDEKSTMVAAWDLGMAKERGKAMQKDGFSSIFGNACMVSRLFGFSALGGRISFSNALPVNKNNFVNRLKLVDSVAIDRFTGGAANRKKFNSRPFFPYYPMNNGTEPDEHGDMSFEIVLEDFTKSDLGMIALLLRDLYKGNILMGYGKTKGHGRFMLVRDSISIEALTHQKGELCDLIRESYKTVGGFVHIPETRFELDPSGGFWLKKQEGGFYKIVEDSVKAFKDYLKAWRPGNQNPPGKGE